MALLQLDDYLLFVNTTVEVAETEPAKAQDPLKVTPGTHKSVFENERVRVLNINLKPGDKVPMHSHPGYVAVALNRCKVKFISPDGKEEEAEFKAGDTVWRGAGSHSAENIGTVELKESA